MKKRNQPAEIEDFAQQEETGTDSFLSFQSFNQEGYCSVG